jgi:hypothetical protein
MQLGFGSPCSRDVIFRRGAAGVSQATCVGHPPLVVGAESAASGIASHFIPSGCLVTDVELLPVQSGTSIEGHPSENLSLSRR